jgi:hypothetical protein
LVGCLSTIRLGHRRRSEPWRLELRAVQTSCARSLICHKSAIGFRGSSAATPMLSRSSSLLRAAFRTSPTRISRIVGSSRPKTDSRCNILPPLRPIRGCTVRSQMRRHDNLAAGFEEGATNGFGSCGPSTGLPPPGTQPALPPHAHRCSNARKCLASSSRSSECL